MSFNDKVAIVTGSSSGIGAAVAIALSAEGASVVIVGRNKDKLAATASRCSGALVIRADITNDDDAQRIINRTVEKFGKIDILVNNAGKIVVAKISDENIMSAYDATLNLNLRAVFRMTNLAIPYLIKTKGNIVNISSVAGHSTQIGTNMLAYCVSKAGLSHFGECVAAYLAQYKVRVNTISPGPVETDIYENSQITETYENVGQRLTALKIVTQPEEIANLVLFVASDNARSITGSNYICDAGWMVKRC